MASQSPLSAADWHDNQASAELSSHLETNVKHNAQVKRPLGRAAGTGSGPGRKSKACSECRKLKMKCEVFPGDKKCHHCLRRKTDCIFKRKDAALGPRDDDGSAATAESYEHRLDAMRQEIQLMRQSLDSVLAERRPSTTHSFQLQSLPRAPTETPGSTTSPTGLSTREDNTQMAMTRENSPEPQPNNDQGGGAVAVEEPMNSLYEVTRLRNIRSNRAKTARPLAGGEGELDDFISRGVISEQEAEELYKKFHTSLNHYLWVGLEQTHSSFHSVRQSSELLTATILTVTALHIPTSAETFDKCYKEFLALISSSMFSRYHNIDDVRGLVVAAFWLSDISWKLSGHAIRIATELNVHQSFARALAGDREHFLRARLWYMLYVCDHHFSIAYGRPPMVSESAQIREHERFLASPLAGPVDARILSQVALMQILTRVYERFAEVRLPDPAAAARQPSSLATTSSASNDALQHGGSTAMLDEADFADLRTFNLEIEQWRVRWHARQQHSSFIGGFPPKGIILYSYFAKLQLNILAVRGVSLRSGRLSTERKEFTNMAISAATSILTFVLEEDDMRRAMVGTPLYVHSMITFAAVFLVKVATKWNRIMGGGFNMEHSYVNVARLLGKMIVLLRSSVTSDRHVLHHIAAGLEKMLVKMTAEAEAEEQARKVVQQSALLSSQVEQIQDQGQYQKLQELDMASQGQGFGSAPGEAWDAYSQMAQGAADLFGGNHTVMDDSLIYEAFGAEASSDVYNFLTSHFNQAS